MSKVESEANSSSCPSTPISGRPTLVPTACTPWPVFDRDPTSRNRPLLAVPLHVQNPFHSQSILSINEGLGRYRRLCDIVRTRVVLKSGEATSLSAWKEEKPKLFAKLGRGFDRSHAPLHSTEHHQKKRGGAVPLGRRFVKVSREPRERRIHKDGRTQTPTCRSSKLPTPSVV